MTSPTPLTSNPHMGFMPHSQVQANPSLVSGSPAMPVSMKQMSLPFPPRQLGESGAEKGLKRTVSTSFLPEDDDELELFEQLAAASAGGAASAVQMLEDGIDTNHNLTPQPQHAAYGFITVANKIAQITAHSDAVLAEALPAIKRALCKHCFHSFLFLGDGERAHEIMENHPDLFQDPACENVTLKMTLETHGIGAFKKLLSKINNTPLEGLETNARQEMLKALDTLLQNNKTNECFFILSSMHSGPDKTEAILKLATHLLRSYSFSIDSNNDIRFGFRDEVERTNFTMLVTQINYEKSSSAQPDPRLDRILLLFYFIDPTSFLQIAEHESHQGNSLPIVEISKSYETQHNELWLTDQSVAKLYRAYHLSRASNTDATHGSYLTLLCNNVIGELSREQFERGISRLIETDLEVAIPFITIPTIRGFFIEKLAEHFQSIILREQAQMEEGFENVSFLTILSNAHSPSLIKNLFTFLNSPEIFSAISPFFLTWLAAQLIPLSVANAYSVITYLPEQNPFKEHLANCMLQYLVARETCFGEFTDPTMIEESRALKEKLMAIVSRRVGNSYLFNQAQSLAFTGSFQRCREFLSRLKASDRTKLQPWLDMMRILHRQEDEVLVAISRSHKSDDRNRSLHAMGQLKILLGDFSRASSFYAEMTNWEDRERTRGRPLYVRDGFEIAIAMKDAPLANRYYLQMNSAEKSEAAGKIITVALEANQLEIAIDCTNAFLATMPSASLSFSLTGVPLEIKNTRKEYSKYVGQIASSSLAKAKDLDAQQRLDLGNAERNRLFQQIGKLNLLLPPCVSARRFLLARLIVSYCESASIHRATAQIDQAETMLGNMTPRDYTKEYLLSLRNIGQTYGNLGNYFGATKMIQRIISTSREQPAWKNFQVDVVKCIYQIIEQILHTGIQDCRGNPEMLKNFFCQIKFYPPFSSEYESRDSCWNVCLYQMFGQSLKNSDLHFPIEALRPFFTPEGFVLIERGFTLPNLPEAVKKIISDSIFPNI